MRSPKTTRMAAIRGLSPPRSAQPPGPPSPHSTPPSPACSLPVESDRARTTTPGGSTLELDGKLLEAGDLLISIPGRRQVPGAQ